MKKMITKITVVSQVEEGAITPENVERYKNDIHAYIKEESIAGDEITVEVEFLEEGQ